MKTNNIAELIEWCCRAEDERVSDPEYNPLHDGDYRTIANAIVDAITAVSPADGDAMNPNVRDIVIAAAAAAQRRYDREYITTDEFYSCVPDSVDMPRGKLISAFVSMASDGVVRRRVKHQTSDNAAALMSTGFESDRKYVTGLILKMIRNGANMYAISADLDIPKDVLRLALRESVA